MLFSFFLVFSKGPVPLIVWWVGDVAYFNLAYFFRRVFLTIFFLIISYKMAYGVFILNLPYFMIEFKNQINCYEFG